MLFFDLFATIKETIERVPIYMEAVKEIHSYDPLFPFIFMYKISGNPDYKVNSYHFHDWYEIVIVHDGEGSFFINKNFYDIKKNEMYLIPADIIHKATSSVESPYVCSVILFHPILIYSMELGDSFSYLSFFHHKNKEPEYQYQLTESEMKNYEELLLHMAGEVHKKKGNRQALLLLLHWILLFFNRNPNRTDIKGIIQEESKSEIWMKEILIYIDMHYMESDLTLSTLANEALVSAEHFSRVFKRTTGFTLPNYLGIKRLFKAKELLLHSNHSISYISDTCGYKSVSYFHHKFKEKIGCTPGEFRKNNRGLLKK